MKPRYTDSHKYPHGYFSARDTDIGRTFARIRLQRIENGTALPRMVGPLKPHFSPRAA